LGLVDGGLLGVAITKLYKESGEKAVTFLKKRYQKTFAPLRAVLKTPGAAGRILDFQPNFADSSPSDSAACAVRAVARVELITNGPNFC
jgi:hypothetical protein